MKNTKFVKIALFALVWIVVIYFAFTYIFRGNIKIKIHNDTFSEQTIWLTPVTEHTYTIPKGEEIKINYSTKEIPISLMLNYRDIEGNPNSIILSEYVEAHEQGTVKVKMKQLNHDEEVTFEIKDKIK